MATTIVVGQFLVLVLGTTGFYHNVKCICRVVYTPRLLSFRTAQAEAAKINRDLSALARLMPERAIACCKWQSSINDDVKHSLSSLHSLPRSTFAGQSIRWAGEPKSRFTSAVIACNTAELRIWLVLRNYVCFCQYTANAFLLSISVTFCGLLQND